MLYEIETSPSNIIYIAEYDQDVVYGGNTYLRFPITHEAISTNMLGEIDAIKVRAANVNREMGALLIAHEGLRGKKVTLKMVFADRLDDPNANIEDVFYIDGAFINQEVVEVILTTKLDLYDIQIPGRLFDRDHCQWTYKQEGCWIWSGGAWTAPGGFANEATDCDKTRAGGKGCKFHMNSLRFGGFPSIPSRGLYVV